MVNRVTEFNWMELPFPRDLEFLRVLGSPWVLKVAFSAVHSMSMKPRLDLEIFGSTCCTPFENQSNLGIVLIVLEHWDCGVQYFSSGVLAAANSLPSSSNQHMYIVLFLGKQALFFSFAYCCCFLFYKKIYLCPWQKQPQQWKCPWICSAKPE